MRDRFDAGAERRAGEQDRIRSGAGRVASQLEEALGHRIGEPAVAREVNRQAVIEQVHQAGVRPKPRERGLDWLDRVLQGVDESNAHGGQSGYGAMGVNPQRRISILFDAFSLREPVPTSLENAMHFHLNGRAYIRPPLAQVAFRPRSSFSGLALPTLRSKISP